MGALSRWAILAGPLLAASLGGCGPPSYDILIQFEPEELAELTVRVEVALIPMCELQSLGAPPRTPLAVTDVGRDGGGSALGEVEAGQYGLYARAWDETCRVLAAGCEPVDLDGGGRTLTVTLGMAGGTPACIAGETCVGGECVGSTEECRVDPDCSDGSWCNGEEQCAPATPFADARGCVPATTGPCPGDSCNETSQTCGECVDADRDGYPDEACGGADCDDGDPNIRPGAVEACNSVDDDCDGTVDEDFDFTADPDNCGRCATICDDAPGGVGICTAGTCGFDCELGLGDCDGDLSDGCETDLLTDETHCGGCRSPCSSICADGSCLDADLRQVAVGGRHSCALDSTGIVLCWGAGERGQLGDGSTDHGSLCGALDCSPEPVAVADLEDVAQVVAGEAHSCARTTSGEVYCWGANDEGQLGLGTRGTDSAVPAPVTSIHDAAELAAGGAHTCVVRLTGAALCWGDNSQGQLGRGNAVDSMSPTGVTGLSGAEAISAGALHTCAISAGEVRCWGDNTEGQLGDGTVTRRLLPTAVPGLAGAVGVGAGESHTCARVVSGAALCWGRGEEGQLGDGLSTSSPSPVSVTDLSGAAELVAGVRHTCARLVGGAVSCWGADDSGQLGNGIFGASATPTSVSGLGTAVSVSAGEASCVALSDGRAMCWGENGSGQVGDGTTTDRTSPVAVSGT